MGTTRIGALRQKPGWPLLPLAPAIVIVVGVLVALAIGIVGVDYLARAGDDDAASYAEVLGATLSAKVSKLPPHLRQEALKTAAKRTNTELLVVTKNAEIVLDASLGPPDAAALRKIVDQKKGEARTGLGRARFSVHRIDAAGFEPGSLFMVAFVREPYSPEGAPAFITALLALTTLLVGVAAAVAYAVVRDASRDVAFVTERVRNMAQARVEPTGETVPVRAMDEIGLLTTAFNELVGRFGAAEKAYRNDLARANAADRDRAAFLAAVSHELRSPLNAILGFADILMEEVDGPLSPTAREEVEQIRASGQHLLELINDILEFSAIESGQLRLQRAQVDVSAIAAEVLREAAVLVSGRPVQLRLEPGQGTIAHADAKRVRQILQNLIGNAIKFTQEGEVVVHVERDASYVHASVRDTGPGISAAERAVIFEEYKQARSERARKRGTGLGLAIARRLVLLHNGTIHVESELGRGSTFHVYLPVYRGQKEAREKA
jgi:signal transduction histidine kinase